MHGSSMAKIGCNRRCYRLEDYVSEENPVRVIEVFIDELELALLGFAGITPAVTGGRPPIPRRC